MAKKETITLYGEKFPCLNLSESVGTGGANFIDDVYLIQAMFKYIASGMSPKYIGLRSLDELPGVTGIFDIATHQTILAYQRRWRTELLKVDGKIHAADYEGRNLRNFPARVMTITKLHFHLLDAALFNNDDDYMTALTRRFPKLVQFI